MNLTDSIKVYFVKNDKAMQALGFDDVYKRRVVASPVDNIRW